MNNITAARGVERDGELTGRRRVDLKRTRKLARKKLRVGLLAGDASTNKRKFFLLAPPGEEQILHIFPIRISVDIRVALRLQRTVG